MKVDNPNPNASQNVSQGQTDNAPKKTEGGKDEKKFESLMEGEGTEGKSQTSGNVALLGTAIKGIKNFQGGGSEGSGQEEGEGQHPTMSDKTFRSILDNALSKELDKNAKDGSDQSAQNTGIPIASFVEPAAPKVPADQAVKPAMNIAEIEKMVDRVLVGVNSTGEPEFRIDMHTKELGDLNIKVTRTDQGLQIQMNCVTDKAGQQLSNNMQALQQALTQKGLQVNNVELLVQNQPIPVNSMSDSTSRTGVDRVNRKDSLNKVKGEKVNPPQGRGPKR
jgi:flagellar hook-length control protein FliK